MSLERTNLKKGINGRNKGANGEREAGRWLKEHFGLENAPERNLEQYRRGGYDLIGFAPFALEVKRTENKAYRDWWYQAVTQCDHGDVPVVMYRRNNQPWRFLISARYIGIKNGYIKLEAREFIMWAKQVIEGP